MSWRECIAAELASAASETESWRPPPPESPALFPASFPPPDDILVHVRGGDRRSHAFHSFCRLAPLIRYLTHRMGSSRVTIAVETQFDKQRVMMAHVPAIMELSPELKVRIRLELYRSKNTTT